MSDVQTPSTVGATYVEPSATQVLEPGHKIGDLLRRNLPEPYVLPEVPWATEIAKDYANLSGQLVTPGTENGPGPAASAEARAAFEFSPTTRADDDNLPVMKSFPATHFWECGQWLDLHTDGEPIRDHLLRALYGT